MDKVVGHLDKTVGRLSLYRRILYTLHNEKKSNVYSHQLANLCRVSAAIVRRDLMSVGYYGNPKHGYQVDSLIKCIDDFFNESKSKNVILVGVGNMGRALLAYFSKGKDKNLQIIAAFDNDESKTDRIICNTNCYAMNEMQQIISQYSVKTGIITVPDVEAQNAADRLVNNGIKGIMNLAPVRLIVPAQVYIENVDITMFLEKVAYFSSKSN